MIFQKVTEDKQLNKMKVKERKRKKRKREIQKACDKKANKIVFEGTEEDFENYCRVTGIYK